MIIIANLRDFKGSIYYSLIMKPLIKSCRIPTITTHYHSSTSTTIA